MNNCTQKMNIVRVNIINIPISFLYYYFFGEVFKYDDGAKF
jgi:hypothetical protein